MASNIDYDNCENLPGYKSYKCKRRYNKIFKKVNGDKHNTVKYYQGLRKFRPSTTRHKKIYAIDRDKERDKKPTFVTSDSDDDDSLNDINMSTASNVISAEQDAIDESSTKILTEDPGKDERKDDPDKDGRINYIKLLSKLIDLNMPSKIESNRSTEAYSRRLFFLEKRRHDSEKSGYCNQLLCHESFWLELQHRFKNRTNDKIQNLRIKTVNSLTKFLNFRVKNVEMGMEDIQREKIYSITKSYVTKIKLAHDQVSETLTNYHYLLSLWPTTISMAKYMSENRPQWIVEEKIIKENIESMQAWQTCCEWLNWKTRQICEIVGITGHCLNDFIIPYYHCNEIHDQPDNDKEEDVKIFQNRSNCQSKSGVDKSVFRSQSLDVTSRFTDYVDTANYDSCVDLPSQCCCESKFEFYADISRRRYGLSKVCSTSIESVRPMLTKFQNLLSITKDENRLPLMFSYADALKKEGNKSRSSTPNPVGNLIFSEHVSDGSVSSYKMAALDNQEYPMIPPSVSAKITESRSAIFTLCTPPMSSNPSQQYFNNDSQSEIYTDYADPNVDMCQSVYSDQECSNNNNSNNNIIQTDEVKGLLGLRNKVAARLVLPPLLPHYLFLARFPVKIMHCCIKKMLYTTDLQKIAEFNIITIKQKIIDLKEALQMTMETREFLRNITYGINFQIYKFHASNTKEFAPKQDIEHSDFIRSSLKEIDSDLSILLRHYIDYLKDLLKKWSQPSSSYKFGQCEPRRLLEEEWNFVKTYCHSIKQEEEIVASSFCNLAEYLFDLLKTKIESHHKLNFDYDASPTEYSSLSTTEDESCTSSNIDNRLMSKSCQTYKNKCKVIQCQLKQAADFAKRLRADLEISIQLELNTNYSMNDLLVHLSRTKHKMVDLCIPDEIPFRSIQSDLTLIIPEESCVHLNELLHPLVTGFSMEPKDDCIVTSVHGFVTSKIKTMSSQREYILIINKKSKINWPGDKILFFYPLDMGNLKQRIESSNIVFIARRPNELTKQLSKLFQCKVYSDQVHSITFKDILHTCSDDEVEACHHNSKRTLNALKSKSIEIGNTLQNFFIGDESEIFQDIDSNISLNRMQEDTLKHSIKNSYSITFEFYRDLVKLCTGDAFKHTLKNSIFSLLDKWFKFSNLFEPSEKGTVPRWANDGLNFLLQLCQSRVVISMTTNEWQDFKRNIDNFVEFIVGQGTKSVGNDRSTPSCRIVTSRSWLNMTRPDIIRGCDSKMDVLCTVGDWRIDYDKSRTLRSAFSDPSRTFKDSRVAYTRSITLPSEMAQHSGIVIQSIGNGSFDNKTLMEKIDELERQLDKKQRRNNMVGFVRDSNSDIASSPYIKKAPFQWIKKCLIGQGHSGTVYKVCNLDTMEIMAMKEIVINEPFAQDRIESELLCKLKNASLLKYYGVDISLSHVRIFTEYCDSGSLSQVTIVDIPEIIVRQWAKEILDAVVYLHDHNIVHRDIKPDNVFLINSEDGNACYAKLGDFGVAKYFGNNDEGIKDVQGTMMYMAPEVVIVDSVENVSKKGYNHKVDIWSLGCVVLYMVTGKNPWPDLEQMSIYYNLGMNRQPHVPDQQCNQRMTKEARDFITGCLTITPSLRPDAIELKNYNFVKLSSSLGSGDV